MNDISNTGFSGSIFKLQPAQPVEPQPASNGGPMFSVDQPLPQSSNPFGNITQQQQPQAQPSNSFQFGAISSQNSTTAQDTAGKPCFCVPGSTTANHKHHDANSKLTEPRAEKDNFGLPLKQPSTPNVSNEPSQASSSIFTTHHSSNGATSPTDMMMSISPDTSPKTSQSSPQKQSMENSMKSPIKNPFASLQIPKPPQSSPSTSPSNILGAMVKSTLAPNTATVPSNESSAKPAMSESLFDRVSYPDPTSNSQSSPSQPNASQTLGTSLFATLSKPTATESSSLFLPDTSQTSAATNNFGGQSKQDTTEGPALIQESAATSSSEKSLSDSATQPDKPQTPASSQSSGPSTDLSQKKGAADPKPRFNVFTPVSTPSAMKSSPSNSTVFAQIANNTAEPANTGPSPAKSFLFSTHNETSKQAAAPTFTQPSAKPALSGAATYTTNASTISQAGFTRDPLPITPSRAQPALLSAKEQEQRRVIAFRRLRALDDGLKLHLAKSNTTGAELDGILDFHRQRREAIADAAGIVLEGTGSKRKAEDDEGAGRSPDKRTKIQQTPQQKAIGAQTPLFSGALAHGVSSQDPFSPENQPVGAKRKAVGAVEHDKEDETHNESSKRSRPDDHISYPVLPANGSKTSQLFASILGDAQSKAPHDTPPTFSHGANVIDVGGTENNSTKQTSSTQSETSKPADNQSSKPSFSIKPMFHTTTGDASKSPPTTPSSSLFIKPQSVPSETAASVEPLKPTNMFSATPSSGTSLATKPPSFKPPTFGSGGPVNFMAQFGKKAEESEKKEREKRKAEDFDSDEDNEAEWERRDAEQQAEKKKKLLEASKGKSAIFTSGGFTLSDSENARASSAGLESGTSSRRPSDSSARGSFVSVLAGPSPAANGVKNMFAHLSDNDSAVEGSKHGDADDEETGSEGEAESTTPKASTMNPSTSLFDRIGPMNNPSDEENSKKILNPFASTGPTSSIFLQGEPSTPKSNPTAPSANTSDEFAPNANPQTSNASPSGDNTWKPGTPLKFGGSTTSAPEVKVSSPSPAKSLPFGTLFGAAPTAFQESPSKPATGALGFAVAKPSVGFDFGSGKVNFGNNLLKPTGPSLTLPSTNTSDAGSRATSPGASTAGESANESTAEDEGPKDEQIDLVSGVDDEGEERLFEVRAKALMYDPKAKEQDESADLWPVKGLGPLRVLRNNETRKTRILMRADPSGKIVLNAGLIPGANYEHNVGKKSVRFMVANEGGELNTYLAKVGKDEDARKLANMLEENKGN